MKFLPLSSIADLPEDTPVFLVSEDGEFSVGRRQGERLLIGTLYYAASMFTHYCIPEV